MKKIYVILAISVLSLSAISAAQVKKRAKTKRSASSLCQTLQGSPNITVCVDGNPGDTGIDRVRLDEVKLVAANLGKRLKRLQSQKTSTYDAGYTNPGYPSESYDSTETSTYSYSSTMPEDPCYDDNGNYVCGAETNTYYTYTMPEDPCYDDNGNYTCGAETNTYYTYTMPEDPCYDDNGNYVCGTNTYI